jgi:tetratricopeptide (TPR) repeat protein
MGSERALSLAAALAALGIALYLDAHRSDAVHLRAANELGESGDYAAAIDEARQIRYAPAQAEGLIAEGSAYAALGDVARASRLYQRAEQLEPNDYAVHYYRALALIDRGDRSAARQELQRVRELNPRFEQFPPGF